MRNAIMLSYLLGNCARESSVIVSKVVTMVNSNRMQRKIASKTSSKAAPVEPESGSQMLIEERRQHILSLAQRQGRVLVEDLPKSLGISRITIRKDLDYLQRRGVLQRTHGGALLSQAGRYSTRRSRRRKGVICRKSSGSRPLL
jgi:biotin operon repressor